MVEANGNQPGRKRSRAFGLEIDSSFEAPGLPAVTGPPVGRGTRMDIVAATEIDARWPAGPSTRVVEERFEEDPEGLAARTIDVHQDQGYRLYARGFGLARVSSSGDAIECAAPDGQVDWSWQRFLVGRVLPWASVLRGYEAFHASAVALGDRAVAFVGPTGWGKTSLALRLVADGAGFITDDVLAIEAYGDGLRVHPGASVASVRPAERAVIPSHTWERLGTVLGHSGKTYLALPMVLAPMPLTIVYFLNGGDGPAVEPISRFDPRLLLSSTFVLGVQSPERLRNQLDICATIAARVPSFWLRATAGADAGRLAQTVADHADHVLAQ